MNVARINKITSVVVLVTQVLVVSVIGFLVGQFFLEPDQRKDRFFYIPQWQLEAKQPDQVSESTKAKSPPPPVFLPPPISSSEKRSVSHRPPFLFTFLPEKPEPLKGRPIKFENKKVAGIPLYLATVDLADPEMFLTLSLPHNATEANSAHSSNGAESFQSFVKRLNGAVVQNGTFFSKDKQLRVMGNMVANGQWLKYSQWENYGTTFGLMKGNVPEMVTARTEGKPEWRRHWFSLTCGPRLIKDGEVAINAEAEGFQDPHVLGGGSRCALGYPKSADKVFLVTFLRGLTLKREAQVMKAMGCYQAMNLDGGASRSMAHRNNIVVPAGRALTNVIVVYDTKSPAPVAVKRSWRNFQRGKAMIQLIR